MSSSQDFMQMRSVLFKKYAKYVPSQVLHTEIIEVQDERDRQQFRGNISENIIILA